MMEAKLQTLISDIESLSDLRNLDEFNPVIFQLEHPVSALKYVIAGSKIEPSYTGFPIYGSWVVLDPTSTYFRQVLILKDALDPDTVSTLPKVTSLNAWWHVVRTYDEVFAHPQYYVNATGTKGDKGDKGDPGPAGAAGPAGPALDPMLVVQALASMAGTLEIDGAQSVMEGTSAHYIVKLAEKYFDANNAVQTRTVEVPAQVVVSGSTHAYIDTNNDLHVDGLSTDESCTLVAEYPSWANIVRATLPIELKLAAITGISITGASSVYAGSSISLSTLATYSDGTQSTISPTYTIDLTNIASISTNGTLTGANPISADTLVTVTATVNAGGATLTATKQVTVRQLVATALTINGQASVPENHTANYTATVTYNSGATGIVTPVWSLSAGAPATVSATGLLTTGEVAADTAVTLTATFTPPLAQAIVATKQVTVTNVVVAVQSFYGVGAAATADYSALVNALTHRGTSGDLTADFSIDSIGLPSFMWYAYPVSYGLAQFFDPLSNFTGGWGGAGATGAGPSAATSAAGEDTPVTANVTINGVSIPFYIYRTEQQNLGQASANRWVVQHKA